MCRRAIAPLLERGDGFTIGDFFDDFFAADVIPIMRTRWELTGELDPILAGN